VGHSMLPCQGLGAAASCTVLCILLHGICRQTASPSGARCCALGEQQVPMEGFGCRGALYCCLVLSCTLCCSACVARKCRPLTSLQSQQYRAQCRAAADRACVLAAPRSTPPRRSRRSRSSTLLRRRRRRRRCCPTSRWASASRPWTCADLAPAACHAVSFHVYWTE
jgi:hypothetical protein